MFADISEIMSHNSKSCFGTHTMSQGSSEATKQELNIAHMVDTTDEMFYNWWTHS